MPCYQPLCWVIAHIKHSIHPLVIKTTFTYLDFGYSALRYGNGHTLVIIVRHNQFEIKFAVYWHTKIRPSQLPQLGNCYKIFKELFESSGSVALISMVLAKRLQLAQG